MAAPLPRSAALAGETLDTSATTTAAMVLSSAAAWCRISGGLNSVPTAEPTNAQTSALPRPAASGSSSAVLCPSA